MAWNRSAPRDPTSARLLHVLALASRAHGAITTHAIPVPTCMRRCHRSGRAIAPRRLCHPPGIDVLSRRLLRLLRWSPQPPERGTRTCEASNSCASARLVAAVSPNHGRHRCLCADPALAPRHRWPILRRPHRARRHRRRRCAFPTARAPIDREGAAASVGIRGYEGGSACGGAGGVRAAHGLRADA